MSCIISILWNRLYIISQINNLIMMIDVSYRQCLRNMFEMNEKIPHTEIDDITNDENNYDEESMSKAMDIVYEKTTG